MVGTQHLTASMRVIKGHEGGRVSISGRSAGQEAAAARTKGSADANLVLLAAKLERACGCGIVEPAKIAKTWESGESGESA